jgi:hypothetical protein
LETAFRLIVSEGVNELLLIVKFKLEVEGVDFGISEFSSTNTLDKLKVSL